MTKEQLILKLDGIEWEDFEVKTAIHGLPKSCWETVSAFSNTNGGWLVLGIHETLKDFEIVGVTNPEKIEHDFLNVLRGEKFNQKISVQCEKFEFNKKIVLAFFIPEAMQKPIYYNSKSNTFLRKGSTDERATEAEIDALFRDSAFGFKDKELTKYTFSDLNLHTIEVYRSYLKTFHPDHQYNLFSDFELMTKLHVLRDHKVTVGGLLFLD